MGLRNFFIEHNIIVTMDNTYFSHLATAWQACHWDKQCDTCASVSSLPTWGWLWWNRLRGWQKGKGTRVLEMLMSGSAHSEPEVSRFLLASRKLDTFNIHVWASPMSLRTISFVSVHVETSHTVPFVTFTWFCLFAKGAGEKSHELKFPAKSLEI